MRLVRVPLTLVSGGDILPSAVIFKPSTIGLKPVVSIDTENCLLSRNLPKRSTSSIANVDICFFILSILKESLKQS